MGDRRSLCQQSYRPRAAPMIAIAYMDHHPVRRRAAGRQL